MDVGAVGRGRTSGREALGARLARNFIELARALEAESDTPALLQRIVDAAVVEVDGALHAGIALISNGKVDSPAYTDTLVKDVDAAQHQTSEGPCLSSLSDKLTIRVDDMRTEQRWPRFASAAADLGVLSMLSVQLLVDGGSLGALNLYAERSYAFTAVDENVGLLFASQAAVVLVGDRKVHNLQTALKSRDVIGQAKGILMERFKIDADQAFGMLVAVSQHHHRKLNLLAEQLAATGELPQID